jgi:hypothetical protein
MVIVPFEPTIGPNTSAIGSLEGMELLEGRGGGVVDGEDQSCCSEHGC